MKINQPPVYTSEQMTLGCIYTRSVLKEQFSITDATLNTGVFQPVGTKSVWLFITEKKSSDRTPYSDLLENNTLQWQGQMKGRTDALIINHQQNDLELLVFYRRKKYEHMGAGFRYEGRFNYKYHTGKSPTSFVLIRTSVIDAMAAIQYQIEETAEFNPSDIKSGKDRMLASIVRRRGQTTFRNKLIEAYDGHCAVTGCNLKDILEAAHIIPYMGEETNHVQNGLLLRTDIHTLFDLHLLTVNPDNFTIELASKLSKSEYAHLEGQSLLLPNLANQQPSQDALRAHKNQRQYFFFNPDGI